jgi:hypothetical protein
MGAKVSKTNAPAAVAANGGETIAAPTAAWGSKPNKKNKALSLSSASPPSPATLTSSPPPQQQQLLEIPAKNELLVSEGSSESLNSHVVKPPQTKDDWSSMMGTAPSNAAVASSNTNFYNTNIVSKQTSAATMKFNQSDIPPTALTQSHNGKASASRKTANTTSVKGSGDIYAKPEVKSGIDSAYDTDIKLEENGSLGHISCSSDFNEEVEVFFAR